MDTHILNLISYYFLLLSLSTVYTSPKTVTQVETIEQTISIIFIPYLPILPQILVL